MKNRFRSAPRAGPRPTCAAGIAACAAIIAFGLAAESRAGSTDGLAAPVTISDGGIAAILPGAVSGDPARGRAIVASRQEGLCLLCHSAPIP